MPRISHYIIALFLFAGLSVQAQQELGLHFIDDIYQSNQTNPALMNKQKIVVSLPSLYGNLYHTGFSFNDVFTETSDGFSLDLNKAIPDLKDDNYLQTNFNLDLLGVAVRLNDLQFGLTLGTRTNGFLNYKKEMIDLYWNGNAGYIGETINLAPDFQFTGYSELGISGAYNWQDKVTVGLKLKYLIGISDFSAADRDNKLDIYTSDDAYQTTFTTDYEVNYSGFAALDSSITELVDGGVDLYNRDNLFPGNSGIAIDLGMTANITDKITVAASIVDLGSLNWKANVGSYASQGTYTYEGLDLFTFVDGDTLNTTGLQNELEAIVDTFTQVIDVQPTSTTSYSTKLPTKIYLSGQYDLLDDLTVGALLYNESYHGKNVPGLALSARKSFGSIFTLGGVYSIRNQRFNNFGINAVAKLGPIQLYMASDNVLPIFRPFNSQNVNFRAGINVAILGEKDKKEGFIGLK